MITAILALLVAVTPILAATTYVWVEPYVIEVGGGNVIVNDDGSLSLLAPVGGAAGVAFETGMTVGELLTVYPNLAGPLFIYLQSVAPGSPAFQEFGTVFLDDWLALQYWDGMLPSINDPNPFYYNPDLFDAWILDPSNAPGDIAELLSMPVTIVFHIVGGPGGMQAWVGEVCWGYPGGNEDGVDGENGQGRDAVCFKFFQSPEAPSPATIRFDPVVVFNYPANFAYTRTWAGSHAMTPRGAAWELVEVGESMLYAPWNVGTDPDGYGSFVKTSWANNATSAEIAVIEFHDRTSAVLGTCLTKRIPFQVSAIDYPSRCYHEQSLEDLIVSGAFSETYAQESMLGELLPVGRVVSGDGTPTWYYGQ